ncbi:MAG TPA: hypothetical protein VM779_11580 [Thermoanaerobaculia bacterium]|nr:hypothetical protein [Thermoanaerobaculia bacterium]
MRIALLFAALLSGCSTAPAPVMSWDAYSRLQLSWPYVISIDPAGPGELFYFGAAHTFDPADPQIARIEEAWREFRPDIAFTEGGFPPFEASRDQAVSKHGESGLLRYLAARDNVPTTTLDPTRADEVAALRSRFSREQIKLFFLLRAVSQFVQRNGPDRAGAEVERILPIYAAAPGLSGSPRSLSELEAAYEDLFPAGGRYVDVQPAWFDPARSGTLLNEIARASSDYRDRFVVERLASHVREGRRVFAVMGGSHVVMQEPALRDRLR